MKNSIVKILLGLAVVAVIALVVLFMSLNTIVKNGVTSFGPEGFSGLWQEGPRRGRLGSQTTHFQAPGLMWHDLTAPGFARFLTVVYATPTRPGECRLFARFPFQFRSPWPARLLGLRPRWLQHIGNHTVLEDDQVFLHWQERVLEQQEEQESR